MRRPSQCQEHLLKEIYLEDFELYASNTLALYSCQTRLHPSITFHMAAQTTKMSPEMLFSPFGRLHVEFYIFHLPWITKTQVV